MCYRLVERYSICRCLYYKHPVDTCTAYTQPGHRVAERTIYVGYLCGQHTAGPDEQRGEERTAPTGLMHSLTLHSPPKYFATAIP